jgi:hypothetical protein
MAWSKYRQIDRQNRRLFRTPTRLYTVRKSSPVRLRGGGCHGGSHITFLTVNSNGICLCSIEHRPPCNQFLLSALGWILEIHRCWLLIRIRWLCFVCLYLHRCRVQSEADLFWVTLLDSDEVRRMILLFLFKRLLSVFSKGGWVWKLEKWISKEILTLQDAWNFRLHIGRY